MNESADHLLRNLQKRIAWWRSGSVTAHAGRLLAYLALALLAVVLFDFFAPLSERMREWLCAFLTAGAIVYWGWGLYRATRVGPRQIAAELDRILDDPRKPVLAAYELDQGGAGARFFRDETIRKANQRIVKLRRKEVRPWRHLRSAATFLGGSIVLVLVVAGLKPGAAWVGLQRLMNPNADIPPYSDYAFEVAPENAKVIYGSDLDLSVAVRGGEVNQPVYLLTRSGGRVERVDCFRGPDNQFTQRVEKISEPFEFAFATGKTRSRWHSAAVMFEPRFAVAKVRITPPAYTNAPVRESVAGGEGLKGVSGSLATLWITSNRPLSRGKLSLPGAGHIDREGESAGTHTVKFEWTMQESGPLSVMIYDVQGTACPEPLVLQQTVLPDAKPDLSLTQPPGFSLATPRSSVPIEGNANDDYGLRRIELVRTVPGFRERAELLGSGTLGKSYDIRQSLDLAALGVRPGDVLEFYLEGRDENPALTGIQTSGVARVEIISEEEYAEMIRNRADMEDLSRRFERMERTLQNVRNALEQAAEQANASPANKEKIAAALEQSAKAAKEAAAFFEAMAKDFPAYDLEKQLAAHLAKAAAGMNELGAKLDALSPDEATLGQTLNDLKAQISAATNDLDEGLKQADEFMQVARTMQLAGQLRGLVEKQRRLARWADRLAASGSAGQEALKTAQEMQRKLEQELAAMPQAMRDASDQLPAKEEYAKLKGDTLAFAARLESCGARQSMQNASESAGAGDAKGTAESAQKAVGQLEGLIEDRADGGCEFAGMCLGKKPGFCKGRPLSESLSEMLKACLSRGRGKAGTGGEGSGGFSDDGYAVEGYTERELPVFGPVRIQFDPQRKTVSSTGSLSESGAEAPLLLEEDQLRADRPEPANDNAGGKIIKTRVPEKYREAVRRYFEPQRRYEPAK